MMGTKICAICGIELNYSTATLPNVTYCPECVHIADSWAVTQSAVQAATGELPTDAEMGAVMRRRMIAWLASSTNAELGAFVRIVRNGSAAEIAEAGSVIAKLFQQ